MIDKKEEVRYYNKKNISSCIGWKENENGK